LVVIRHYGCSVRVLPLDADATDVEATRGISDEEGMKVSATVRNMPHKRDAPVYVVSGAFTTMDL
jgi:hypothetical protein